MEFCDRPLSGVELLGSVGAGMSAHRISTGLAAWSRRSEGMR
jgi:hypothetical protein